MNLETLKNRMFSFFSGNEMTAENNRNTRFLRLILTLGILGMLMIGLSECGNDTPKTDALPVQAEPSVQAARELESQLLRVLQEMEGVGRVELLITMEGTGESIYATEEQEQRNSESIYSDDGAVQSIQNSHSTEQNYLLVENQEGQRQALLISRSEPQVKGVIVICDGADNPIVREAVTEAVKTVLNITSNRVYVAKAKAER